MSSKSNLRNTLIDGLEQLVRDGSNKNYWLSTRATADSVIALSFCLPLTEFNNLRKGGLKYMLSKAEESSGNTLNWDEEVWDTSIAAMALAVEPVKYAEYITKASNWIKSKYLITHTSWNEEIWETLLALNSIAYLHQNVPSIYEVRHDFTSAVEWLMRIVDTPKKGLLINWSSTALFVLLANSSALHSIAQDLDLKTRDVSQKCANVIFEADILENDELLWTPEVWSNGLVLWALAVSKSESLSVEKSFKIAKWFKERIVSNDLPAEDRAFACIGLYKYIEFIECKEFMQKGDAEKSEEVLSIRLEEVVEKLQERIVISLKQRISDFQSIPPLFTRESFLGYYSINIRSIIINVILIIGVTFMLSYLTWQSQNSENKTMKWLIVIPIFLGALATVAQLANFTLIPKRKSSQKNKNLIEDEN